jgi:hypothetical protein
MARLKQTMARCCGPLHRQLILRASMNLRRKKPAFAVMVALIGFSSHVQPKQVTPGVAREGPQKYALLVGIDHYKYSSRIPPLGGALNDVENLRQVLIEKFHFPDGNITVLKESAATHAAIIGAIQSQLISKARSGDIVIFHFSGHGSQTKDVTGKMISGIDETIVPYDSRDPDNKVFDINGAELHPLLEQLANKTRNVTFILDSCHSGSLVRGARTRGISPDTRAAPSVPGAHGKASLRIDGLKAGSRPAFAFIAAASSRESAFEYFAEGREHGALTYFLTRQIRASGDGATYRDLMDSVTSNVTAHYPGQHPSLEGAESDQQVFGDSTSLTASFVAASPSSGEPKDVTLNIGALEGATVGSVYDLYAPGTKTFTAPARPTGRAQIIAVGDFSSEGVLLPGGTVLPASRAIEREHSYGDTRVRLFIDQDKASKALESVRSALESTRAVALVKKPTLCDLQLRQDGKTIRLLAADSTILSPPVAAGDQGMVSKVVDQVRSWAKWFHVLSISNAQSEIELQFTVDASRGRETASFDGQSRLKVTEGDLVEATLTNRGGRDLYVAILDLARDGGITIVYPVQEGTQEVLKPGAALKRSFNTFIPKGLPYTTDILKVFASYEPFDLSPLTQDQIRGALTATKELSPLQEMLLAFSEQSRGTSSRASRPLTLNSWITLQRVLVVKRAPDSRRL